MLLPSTHQAALEADLEQATGMLTVGWRAREDHFLQVIADKLPSRRRLPLFTVGYGEPAVLETIDNLWWTGRFDAYAGFTGGFSTFCQVDGRKPNVSGQGLSALLHGASLCLATRDLAWRCDPCHPMSIQPGSIPEIELGMAPSTRLAPACDPARRSTTPFDGSEARGTAPSPSQVAGIDGGIAADPVDRPAPGTEARTELQSPSGDERLSLVRLDQAPLP